MSDPAPIKALDWHGFLRILAAHDTQTTLSANTISADALDGVQIDRKRLGALFKAAADAGYLRHVDYDKAARDASKGHLIRVWKRTTLPLPGETARLAGAR